MIELNCLQCGAKFRTYPSRIGIKKYCSNHCKGLNTLNLFKMGNRTNIGREASESMKNKLSRRFKGSIRPELVKSKQGENNPNWKGGVSPINKRIRRSSKFFQWRKLVFERDNYTCQICNKRGGELHPDHIKQFAYHPELRFDINNGRTLCKECHMKTDTWGFKKHPLPEKQV